METIKALPMLGVNEDNIARYSIRLSKVLPWFDPTNLMFNPAPESQERFYDHLFGRRWPGGDAHNIVGDIVLQFQELEEKSGRYVFCGAFHRGPVANMGNGHEIYQWQNQEIEEYRPFVGRMIVHYRRQPGYTGMDFRLNKAEFADSFMDTMTVEAIKNNALTAKPFPGFSRVRLTHGELATVLDDEEWKSALSSVNGIYLQTDLSNGWHYVGSAYGTHGQRTGLFSRLCEYAGGDHTGGNKLLRQIPDAKEHIEKYFQYSILEIFDPGIPARQIIQRENWWMDTLSSVRRQDDPTPHGYNRGHAEMPEA